MIKPYRWFRRFFAEVENPDAALSLRQGIIYRSVDQSYKLPKGGGVSRVISKSPRHQFPRVFVLSFPTKS
jgi:hypothetical protein